MFCDVSNDHYTNMYSIHLKISSNIGIYINLNDEYVAIHLTL